MATRSNLSSRRFLARVLTTALLAAFALPLISQAQTAGQAGLAWPVKTITVIVNVPAGTSVDVVARGVAERVAKELGQAIVIDNRTGAAGNVGSEVVAKAAPDGYTMLFSPASAITVNQFIYSSMRFDPLKDLTPVAAAANVVSILVTKAELPFKTPAELVAYAKANPGKLTYGTPGIGSVPHIVAENFNAVAGINTLHVPYRGGSLVLQDMLGGQVDFVFDSGLAIPHIRSGKLKLLGTAMPKRTPMFPDVPTLGESGLKDLDGSTIFGFFAPAGTPAAIVNRFNAEVNKALAQPALREQIAALGAEVVPMTPAQYRASLEATAKVAAAVVKERQIKVD
jgi:tripartite-type tricarboxylate transporter receptor subunit TctC